jgi:LytS/YehU family sensor histidine kinase
LASEVDFVTRYLAIEQVRFGDRLRVTIDVPRQLAAARVPVFILQPFVENSLKHGVLRGREGNEIVISARASGASLELRVSDDGRGLGASSGVGEGLGISNARRRLERMYGTNASLLVQPGVAGRGVDVHIVLALEMSNDAMPMAAVPTLAGV